MQDMLTFDPVREGYTITVTELGTNHRVLIPSGLMDDEVGADADDAARMAWLQGNFANILQAITARQSGGMVREPWGRLLVEEINDAN